MKRVLLLAGLLVCCSSVTAQTGGVARVAVKVPRDARLFVDDVFCPLPGEWRIFDTPPLEADRKYGYTLTVEINHDGKPVRVKKQIVVQANRTTEFDFGMRAAIIAAAQKDDGKAPPPPLPGQKQSEAPRGFPPLTARATAKDGKIILEVVVFKEVEVDVTFDYQEGGVTKKGIKKEKKLVSELNKQEVPLKDIKAVDTDNKPIAAEKLAELLATTQVVLFSHAPEVDPFYLSTTKKGTVILLMPPRVPPTTPGGPKITPLDPPRRSPTPIPPPGAVRQMLLMQPEKGEARPTGMAPDLVEASLVGTVIEINRTVTVYEYAVIEAEEVGADGKVRRVKKTKAIPVTKTYKMQIDPKKALLSTAGGKDASIDDVKRILAKPALIVLGNDHQPIDKFYLQLFDENLLVVVPPPPVAAPQRGPLGPDERKEDRP